MSKAPKKKESKERVTSAHPGGQKYAVDPSVAPNIGAIAEERGKRSRAIIPVWPEWSDQDIASEKWDVGHRGKADGKAKTTSATLHFFEDPEGKLELPPSIKQSVKVWKRPVEFMESEKPPTVLEHDTLKEKAIDLLSANGHIAGSEVARWLISGITALIKINHGPETETLGQNLKTKGSKDMKEVKLEKSKRDLENSEDAFSWKPWHHIWPKDNAKGYLFPAYNSSGKYCVKLHWMGCWRKITVDDLMPLDEEGRVLFPMGTKENEIWPLILSKALLKVASLDYAGGIENSEFGDWSVISCLTGWIPEPIPLKHAHKGKIWKLLLSVLPNWKLPEPHPPTAEVKQTSLDTKAPSESQVSQKADGNKIDVKDSKEMKEGKNKKEEKEKGKGHEEKKPKEKVAERGEKDLRSKEKGGGTGSFSHKTNTTPEFVLFASYSTIPKTPLKITTLREMADASETLRQCGLSHNHPHILLLTSVRNCPLVAPPPPVLLPRWKLIRQKKKKPPVESDPAPLEEPKDPEFVQVFSPFLNYCVSPVPVSRTPSPTKWDKFKPQTPMESVDEEHDLSDNEVGEAVIDYNPSSGGDILPVETDVTGEDIKEEDIPTTDKLLSSKETVSEMADSKDKKGNRSPSVDTSSGEQMARGRKLSKYRDESKVLDHREIKRSSKDSRDGTKVSDSPKAPATEVVDDIEIKDETQDKEDDDQDKVENAEHAEEQLKLETKLWMDYEDFTKCFSTLWIYHKPTTYPFFKTHTEIKGLEQKSEKSKRSGGPLNAAGSMVALTPTVRGQASNSPAMYGSHLPHTEPPSPYLLVDSLKDAEITVGFSSFSRWFDQNIETAKSARSKEAEKDLLETFPDRDPDSIRPTPGVVIAEPYSWKSLVAGQPPLRIRTTGIKGVVLSLPAGRHFLRLMVQAPLGYHIDICSQTAFVFGDEDSVMQHLTKESARFVHQAVATTQEIGRVIKMFAEPSTGKEKYIDLGLPRDLSQPQDMYIQDLYTSFCKFAREELGENAPPELAFAVEALKLKTLLHLPCDNQDCLRKLRSDSVLSRRATVDGLTSRTNSFPESMPLTSNVHYTQEAATKIQAHFRGYYLRKLRKSFEEGTHEHRIVAEVLTTLWNQLSSNIETSAVKFYRILFELRPGLYPLYPFYKDEWTRVAYADYYGNYNEQTSNTWFVVFREVFYVQNPVLVVPRLYINIPSCVLRVIDNDTKEDLPRVFMKVAPRELIPNQNGYTFVADAKCGETPIPAGKFRLRLIGASDPLPAPCKDVAVNTSFNTKEFRDYYIPNRHNIIMRYTVKVLADTMTSIQFGTSKSDVYFKLEVSDHDEEVISAQGKGHLVLPALIFYADETEEQDGDEAEKPSRAGSRHSSRRASLKALKPGKRSSLPRISPVPKTSKKAEVDPVSIGEVVTKNKDQADSSSEHDGEVFKPIVHKYIIQVTVLRDSWPLSRSNWDFVASLKRAEKEDTDTLTEPSRTDKEKRQASPKGRKAAKKDADGRTSKSQNPSPRPTSRTVDTTKPSWVLRVAIEGNGADIDIKKDTERQDEIKALKAAWEAAEPGRAAKARQNRLKFLSENTIPVEKGNLPEEDEGEIEQIPVAVQGDTMVMSPTSLGPSENELSQLTLIPPPADKEYVLKPFDISPFIRTLGRTVILDEVEQEKIHKQHVLQQVEFLNMREEVLRRREEDLNQRNAEKEAQLQFYEDVQAKVDEIRAIHKSLREKYCQKYAVHSEQNQPPEVEFDKKRKTPSPGRGGGANKGKVGSKSPNKGKKK